MYDTILVPTDGSEGSAHVALQAIDLAEQYGAAIHVLYVVDDNVRSIIPDIGRQSESLEKKAETAIERVTKRASVHGVEAVGEVREGDPADEILAYADTVGADLITMGTRRGDYAKNMMGSVSQKVVARASMPVLTTNLAEE